jgi:photosystem II stability/assembly factor-like uncharacterized protein
MRAARHAPLAALLALASCRVGAPYVRVQVIDEATAAITQLEVTSTFGGKSVPFAVPADPTGAPIAFPNSFTVELPSGASGQLELAISARDAGGNEVATATGVTPVDGNAVYDMTVVLRAAGDGGSGDGPPGDLAMGPDLAKPEKWVKQTPGVNQLLLFVWSAAPDDVYVIGYSGTILHTSDHGATWTPQTSNAAANLIGIWGSSGQDVYIVGNNNVIRHSTGDGTWTSQSSPAAAGTNLYTVWGSGPNDVWIGGAGGVLLHSTGNGTWSTQTSPASANLWSIWGSAGTMLMCGDGGKIYRSVDGGMTFGTSPSGYAGTLSQLWGSTLTDVYIAGNAGHLLHSGDGGQTWASLVINLPTTEMWCVWGSGPNDVWVSGDNGTILHSDNGITWPLQTSGVTTPLYTIWGSGPGDVYAAGSGPTILHLQ